MPVKSQGNGCVFQSPINRCTTVPSEWELNKKLILGNNHLFFVIEYVRKYKVAIKNPLFKKKTETQEFPAPADLRFILIFYLSSATH